MTVTWEVIGYEPPNRIEVKSIQRPVKVTSEYTFEAVAEGRTKVTVRGEADIGGIFKVAETLVERMAQGQWETSFANLMDVLED